MVAAHTEDEIFAEYRKAQRQLAESQLRAHRDSVESFKRFAAKIGITLSDTNFDYAPPIGIVVSAPGIADRLLERIERERDDLLSFDTLRRYYTPHPYQAGYLCSEQFMLMAHPHFRRAMYSKNNYAPSFIAIFWSLNEDGIKKYIALDSDRVRINVDDSAYFELDTWFGAEFNSDIEKIPNGIAKLRPPLDLKQSHVDTFFADAHCLDIKWSQEKNIKTFQALELKSNKTFLIIESEKVFPARYIHAEFDLDSGSFRHFDGAVQYYSESEYMQRREADFNYNAKTQAQIKSRSKKLFKLNGRIETKIWVELCCHFFTGNPLTFEYYTGSYPIYVQEALSRIRGSTNRSN